MIRHLNKTYFVSISHGNLPAQAGQAGKADEVFKHSTPINLLAMPLVGGGNLL